MHIVVLGSTPVRGWNTGRHWDIDIAELKFDLKSFPPDLLHLLWLTQYPSDHSLVVHKLQLRRIANE